MDPDRTMALKQTWEGYKIADLSTSKKKIARHRIPLGACQVDQDLRPPGVSYHDLWPTGPSPVYPDREGIVDITISLVFAVVSRSTVRSAPAATP